MREKKKNNLRGDAPISKREDPVRSGGWLEARSSREEKKEG